MITINNLQEYITEIERIYTETKSKKHLFFRGHPDKEGYKLIPSVLRKEEGFKEREILLDFKQYAPRHQVDYSYLTEIDKMLVYMQHYKLPTRLLDWTVAPLNALYFACSKEVEKRERDPETGEMVNTLADAEVIVLHSFEYWKKIVRENKRKHPEIHQIHITARALLAAEWKFDQIAERINKQYDYPDLEPNDIYEPFAFVASFANDRILHQRGVFTIHGTDHRPLEEFEAARDVLFRITIPANQKSHIIKQLNMLYINDYSIYPDFEGMGNSIKKNKGLFNV